MDRARHSRAPERLFGKGIIVKRKNKNKMTTSERVKGMSEILLDFAWT